MVADLTDILATPCGRDVLRRIYAAGEVVTIERPSQTQPPNAWIQFRGQAVGAEVQRRVLLAYDPCHWPTAIDPRSPASDAVLFALLNELCEETAGTEGVSPVYVSDAVSRYQRERGRA